MEVVEPAKKRGVNVIFGFECEPSVSDVYLTGEADLSVSKLTQIVILNLKTWQTCTAVR